LTPHSPAGALLIAIIGPHAALSNAMRPAGLTSKPHHAHWEFPQLTWTALPATGIGFQPQTRTLTECHYRPVLLKIQGVLENNFRKNCRRGQFFVFLALFYRSERTRRAGCSLKSSFVTRKSGMRGASCACIRRRKSSTPAMGQSAFTCVL